MSAARLVDLGVRPYREVWAMQRELHARVADGSEAQTWIFVEHPPVITLGRNTDRRNVLLSREALEARGIEVVEIERGGDVTFHNPGQLVVYPIRRLERFREVAPLVRALEQAVIDACSRFGVEGERWSDHPGVWVGGNQLCAIGLAVRSMTSLHGLALNVCNDLSYDALIHPCGVRDRGLTNLERETGRPVSVVEARDVLRECIENVFDLRFEASTSARGAVA